MKKLRKERFKMGDYISKARQSIDEAIDFFLKRINEISENGPYRKARRIPTTFPMLKLGNDEFYEYAYFERTLEWFVRDLLINTILHDLLTIHNIESMWPDNKNYVRYSTESIEDIFPFEFIFINTFRPEPLSQCTMMEPVSSTPQTVPSVPTGGACASSI